MASFRYETGDVQNEPWVSCAEESRDGSCQNDLDSTWMDFHKLEMERFENQKV